MMNHAPVAVGIRSHHNDGFTLDCTCSWVCPLYSTPEGASNGWATHAVNLIEQQARAAHHAYTKHSGS